MPTAKIHVHEHRYDEQRILNLHSQRGPDCMVLRSIARVVEYCLLERHAINLSAEPEF